MLPLLLLDTQTPNSADMASGYGLAGGECAFGHPFIRYKSLVAVQW